ncbi:tetratricopeptide repeat protein [Actinokineospora sp. 24-640]
MSWWRRRARPAGPVLSNSTVQGPSLLAGGDITGVTVGETHIHLPARNTPAARVEILTAAAGDAVFTGRVEPVRRLLAALDPAASGEAVVVSAGMGGVGKTALTRHCAARAAAAGWFPGGVFSVDVLGYGDNPVPAESVLSPLLRGLGVAPERIPVAAADAQVVYQQVLARLGERVLLLVDNASTSEQVRPLLPAPGTGHAVVVTTRDTLDLPARPLTLDVLDDDESVALLTAALRAIAPEDRRLADAGGARELARACAGLPLALRIASPLLAEEPDVTAAELARQLRKAPGVDGYAHGEQAVAAVLDLSWNRLVALHPERATTLRLLCLSPGPDVATGTAAALTGHPADAVRVHLRGLRHAHLVRRAGSDRWSLHDLIRAHTTTRTPPDLDPARLDAAENRVLDHYALTAERADTHLRALRGQDVQERFTGREDALRWFDDERANLVAAVAHASTSHHDHAVRLGNAVCVYLEWRRYFPEGVAVATHAHASAAHLTPRHVAGAANRLGLALRQVRRFEDALVAHERSLALHRELGNRGGEGAAWNNIGLVLQEMRRFDEAVDAHERDLAICRNNDDRRSEGIAWNNLALALNRLDRFGDAIAALERARAICQELGDRYGEGAAWTNLGMNLRKEHRFDEAIVAYERARAICGELDDLHGEGLVWDNLGAVLFDMRRFDEATAAYERALRIYQDTSDAHREGTVWNGIGQVSRRLRRFDEALDAHERELAISQELADPEGEAKAWNNIGLALRDLNRPNEAITALRRALVGYLDVGNRFGEGLAWSNLGLAFNGAGRSGEAIAAHERARSIHRELGERRDEAGALMNLGLALRKAKRLDEAVTAQEQARALFQQAGERHLEAGAWLNLGLIFRDLDRSDEATGCWHQAWVAYTETGDADSVIVVEHLLYGTG